MFGMALFYLVLATPFILFAAAVYGDKEECGKWFWQKGKPGVNSGAKFG